MWGIWREGAWAVRCFPCPKALHGLESSSPVPAGASCIPASHQGSHGPLVSLEQFSRGHWTGETCSSSWESIESVSESSSPNPMPLDTGIQHVTFRCSSRDRKWDLARQHPGAPQGRQKAGGTLGPRPRDLLLSGTEVTLWAGLERPRPAYSLGPHLTGPKQLVALKS